MDLGVTSSPVTKSHSWMQAEGNPKWTSAPSAPSVCLQLQIFLIQLSWTSFLTDPSVPKSVYIGNSRVVSNTLNSILKYRARVIAVGQGRRKLKAWGAIPSGLSSTNCKKLWDSCYMFVTCFGITSYLLPLKISEENWNKMYERGEGFRCPKSWWRCSQTRAVRAVQ